MYAPEPIWTRTPYIWWIALDISRVTEYRLFAPFWLLPGRPWWAGYWHAVLGRQNFPKVCLCLAHTDICSTTVCSKSKRPALARISSPSVIVSRDKWTDARWLSIDSVQWSKLKKPEMPLESLQIPERDRKHDILFRNAQFPLLPKSWRQGSRNLYKGNKEYGTWIGLQNSLMQIQIWG